MEHFLFRQKLFHFLSFKQMFDSDTALDGKPMDFQSSLALCLFFA